MEEEGVFDRFMRELHETAAARAEAKVNHRFTRDELIEWEKSYRGDTTDDHEEVHALAVEALRLKDERDEARELLAWYAGASDYELASDGGQRALLYITNLAPPPPGPLS